MSVRLSVAIQHHPRRPELIAPLVEALRPLEADVVLDPDPEHPRRNPWRTYRRALEETPSWATHRLILQDDAEPCRDFGLAAPRALAGRPDALVVFCVLGAPRPWATRVVAAANSGSPWAVLDVLRVKTWLPVVAVSWPVAAIRPALDWIDEQRWPREFIADDEIVGRVARGLELSVLATAPSLVDHPDVVASAVGRRRARGGANPARVAACRMPEDCDVLTFDWR